MSDAPRTVPAFLERTRRERPDRVILQDSDSEVTREALLQGAAQLAEGLRAIGVKPGDRVGFFADNSRRWILTDLALQLARAISVPRGTDTPQDEIAEIFRHADVDFAIVHDARRAQSIEEVRERLPSLGEIICLDPKGAPGRTVDQLQALGKDAASFGDQADSVQPEDIATIIYTSGTTGRPKGVVLTQANFAHQVRVLPDLFAMSPEEVFLSILPPWHIFERTVEYAALVAGAGMAYTDRRRFKSDLAKYRPTFMASVPRLWETVYTGVHKAVSDSPAIRRQLFRGALGIAKTHAWGRDHARGQALRVKRPRGIGMLGDGLTRVFGLAVAAVTWPLDALGQQVVFKRVRAATGGRMRGAVSGGGLMPPHIDSFFRAIGVPILVGYGLTETSPVVACRLEERNLLGTIGTAVPEVDIEIRDLETGRTLPPGQIGLVFTRGPNVMQGYHKDEALTREVIDANGWFNTGDLGFLTEFGDLCFRGRAKETIVLSGGENVEPSHVESELVVSPLISQAIVVGQDRKTLAALLLPEPDAVAQALGLPDVPAHQDLASRQDVAEILRQEAIRRTTPLLPFERVARIAVLPEPLDVASGCLTQTLKLKRHVIVDRFADLIDTAYG